MANYCMKCGAVLTPGSRFCLKCGTPVPNMAGKAKISESKKTVKTDRPHSVLKKTETEYQPRKPVKNSGNSRDPKKYLIVLLAAVLAFTAFVKPGFLVNKDKPDFDNATLNGNNGSGSGGSAGKPQPETPRELSDEVTEFHEDTGSSRVIDSDPAEGVHVHADAGAFDQDTEIRFTPADENDAAVIAADAKLKEDGLWAIAGWEVDAGLADDEQMPGLYDVDIDLDTLDIDPSFYDCLQVVRFNDAGEYYSYRTVRDGSRLKYSSNQNSLTFVCLIGGAVAIFAEIEYIQRNKYFLKNAGSMKNDVSKTDFFKRQVLNLKSHNDYASWVIEFRMDDIDPNLDQIIARIAQIEAACMAEAEEYRKTLGIFSRFRENYHVEKYYQEELAANEEHTRLVNELKMPEIIEYINECADLSFKYLYEQENIRMPVHEVPYKILNNGGDLADAITRKGSFSYVDVHLANVNREDQTDRDNLLLTMTHESFHICQNMYRLPIDALTDSTRFDEMVVIVVENNALKWYQDKAYIITDPNTTDINRWNSLRLPADSNAKGVKGEELNKLLINEGYNLGDFLMYLKDECGLKVIPSKLMKARSMISKANTSDPVRSALGLSEKEFDRYWRSWLISRRNSVSAVFYEQFTDWPYMPVRKISVKPGEEYSVKLEHDDSYFLRLRGFEQKASRHTAQPVIIVPDENIRAVFPEATLVPAAPYFNTEKGVFVPEFLDYNRGYRWLGVMEIHGAVDKTKTAGDAGYTLYAMDQTKKPVLLDYPDEGYFAIQLPEAEGLAKKKLIDGWKVSLRTSTGVRASNYPGLEKAGKTLKVRYSDITDKDDPYSPVDVSVTLTEFVTDTKDEKHLGIESEKAEMRITPKRIRSDTAFIPYDGPVIIEPGPYSSSTAGNILYDSLVAVEGLTNDEREAYRQQADAIMGQAHLTITEDGHFTLKVPGLPDTAFISSRSERSDFQIHADGFSVTGQAVLGYKPRWGYATDKVNTPSEWIAEDSQVTANPKIFRANRVWGKDRISSSDYLWANNGIDEYGRKWEKEEYLTTNSHGGQYYANRWRLHVQYSIALENSLDDEEEKQFYVGWNEEEGRYDFSVNAYMIKKSSYYEDGNLINDVNYTGTTETVFRISGYFYDKQP